MRNRIWMLGLCLTVAVSCWTATAAPAPEPAATEETAQEVRAAVLLVEGIHHYRKNEFEQALAKLEEVLTLRPTSQDVLTMRRKADLGMLVQMTDDEKVGSAASKVLEMITQTIRTDKREIADVDQLLINLQMKDMGPYLTARATFIAHGPYSVPHLVPFMVQRGPKNQRIVARTVALLTDIGRDVCHPMLALLSSDDDVLKHRAVAVLGQIGDRRAIPSLLALAQDPDTPPSLAVGAKDALKNITGKPAAALGPAVKQYQQLAKSYLYEDKLAVGYVFGTWQDMWSWNPGAEKLQDRLTFDLLPSYLYYQHRGTQVAQEGLVLAPEDATLQSLLVCLQVRQLQVTKRFIAAGLAPQMQADAQERAGKLAARTPVVAHGYDGAIVGEALKYSLDIGDGATSLYLVNLLGAKVGLEKGPAGKALLAALDSSDKDVRYYAAVQVVRASPRGLLGDPDKVMQVMSAALKRATARTALLVLNDLQARNKLRTVLRAEGLITSECMLEPNGITKSLNIQPGIDIVFIGGNVSAATFQASYELLRDDARTEAVPMYAVVDSKKASADLAKAKGLTGVISPDEVRQERMANLLKEALAAEDAKEAGPAEQLVLAAAVALAEVDPAVTKYPLDLLEPALISALKSHGEQVQLAVAAVLELFGSPAALTSLAELVAGEHSPALKAKACYALAAVGERNGKKLPDEVVATLRKALQDDSLIVRQAAGEALSVSGVSGEEILGLLNKLPEASAPIATQPGAAVADATPAVMTETGGAGAGGLIGLAPPGAFAAVVVDVQKLVKSGVLDKSAALKGLAQSDQLPITPEQLQSVTVFVAPDPRGMEHDPWVIGVVKHIIPKAKLDEAIADQVSGVTDVEGKEVLELDDMLLYRADDNTMLLASSKEAMVVMMGTWTAGKGAPSAGLTKAVQKYSARPVCIAVLIPDEAKEQLAMGAPDFVRDVQEIAAGLGVTGDNLEIGATVTFAEAASAQLASDLANDQLKGFKAKLAADLDAVDEGTPQAMMGKTFLKMVEGVKVSAKGADLIADVKLSIKDIEKMVPMLGMMLMPMVMGVGGGGGGDFGGDDF